VHITKRLNLGYELLSSFPINSSLRRYNVGGGGGGGNGGGGGGTCVACGAAAGGTKLRTCSRCRLARYCGRDCQRAHWKLLHKNECVPCS